MWQRVRLFDPKGHVGFEVAQTPAMVSGANNGRICCNGRGGKGIGDGNERAQQVDHNRHALVVTNKMGKACWFWLYLTDLRSAIGGNAMNRFDPCHAQPVFNKSQTSETFTPVLPTCAERGEK